MARKGIDFQLLRLFISKKYPKYLKEAYCDASNLSKNQCY